jgi:hypothetical protein
MPTNLQLLKVVALDASGQAVRTPLDKWKLSYVERNATLEIACPAYAKRYDLRKDLAAVAPGETREKVAIGKTLGRLALTGLLHGRHAAGADLRWGGIDRDESMSLYLIFKDTTTVSMELDSDEMEYLLKEVPQGVATEESYQSAVALSKRVKAMAQDGPRVLTELDAKAAEIGGQVEKLTPLVESAATFDERHLAREQCAALQLQLAELGNTRTAVLYELAVYGLTSALPLANELTAASVATMAEAAPVSAPAAVAPPTTRPIASLSQPARAVTKQSSASGKIVKILVALVGAFVGLMVSMLGMLFFGPLGFLAIPVITIGGGWISLRMLDTLMRR